MAILEVDDIHTYYGDAYVLQGLSLRLEQGQILGLLGRNGVGKSTLVNSICGFNPPRRGRIVFKGADITRTSSFETVRRGMGLVPQGRRVFPTLSVEENLVVAERNVDRHGWNLERVYALFPRLLERRRQRAKTLSGGEQQMLAIGRGLMTNPDCLIMDAVDPAGGAERASCAQAGRLRARDEQGPGGLFGVAGRIARQRRGQVELSGYLSSS
jgi:branched-chain amino acid transport system ATP-binding protein